MTFVYKALSPYVTRGPDEHCHGNIAGSEITRIFRKCYYNVKVSCWLYLATSGKGLSPVLRIKD